ncbi:DUF1214 domain-containing protein [Agrobacterium vitis]|uniref:DUF1214 domain-containing protein n=1 Tax=Agrobacterium vitis TaxID=373 RepID=UPI0013A8F1FA|nr:DUF1214 domain-containing protein [Agrobacterium vitis]
MLRVPLLVAIALAIAFGLGIQSTLMALNATVGFGEIEIDGWRAFPQAQTADADPYARSHRAKAGRLLLGSAEGLSFIATTDMSGHKLNTRCRYRLAGTVPMARYWTLSASRPDGTPLPTALDLPGALNSVTTLKNRDASMEITIGSQAAPGNWLAIPTGSEDLMLNLTLLDTPVAGNSGLVTLAMPHVEQIGCGNA